MSKIYDLIKPLAERFHGCDVTRKKDYGSVSSVTPEKDGWLVAAGTANASTGAAPVIRIQIGDDIIGENIGIVGTGNRLTCSAHVKAGVTYTINRYRCNAQSAILYY